MNKGSNVLGTYNMPGRYIWLVSRQVGSIWTLTKTEELLQRQWLHRKGVWLYLKCKEVVCVFLTEDKWRTSVSVLQECLSWRKEKSRSLRPLKWWLQSTVPTRLCRSWGPSKRVEQTWKVNFLSVSPSTGRRGSVFWPIPAHRFPVISDIQSDSKILKNEPGVVIGPGKPQMAHRWY